MSNEEQEAEEEQKEGVVEEIDESEPQKTPKMEKVTESYQEYELLNKNKPIWTRSPDEITTEEYTSFYKGLTSDWDDYFGVKHFQKISFAGLLAPDILVK